MNRQKFGWLVVSGALLSAVMIDAAAADGDPTVDRLEEIVVTALRRETRLIDTPVAVTAIGAEEIERERIVDLSDVQLKVPNLIFTQVTRQETFVSIRGTGMNNDTPGSDLGVAIFIDGVPRTGVHDYDPQMFDLQSIEVLRGPQGTLFGRNTTGGAVVIRTRDPSFEPFYKARLTYGNYNLGEAAAYATGPLIGSVLAGGLAFNLHRRDGYVNNLTLERKDGAERTASVRGKLLWTPADDVRAVFAADYLRDGSESRVGSLESTFVPSLMPTLGFGPDFTNEGRPPRAGNTIIGLTSNVDWSSPWGTLTSITGFRSVTSSIDYSPLADPTTQLLSDQHIADRQYSQELHLASPDKGALTWLGGLFYLHVNRRDGDLYTVNPFPGALALAGLPVGAQQLQNQEVLTTSKAVFGEATYHLSSSLGLTAGARYSWETRSGHSEITPTEASGPYEHSWSAFTPKGTVSYKPTDELLSYLTVSKGFQSGGFDAGAGTSEGLRTPFNPETVVNYELGLKASALERTLSFNADVFFEDYSNLQRTAFDSNPSVNAYRTTNAGKGRVKGVEADAAYLAAKWLKLSGDYAYTDAKYREYLAMQDDGSVANYSGNIMPEVPKHQVHVAAEVTMPWAATGGDLIAGADYTYRSTIQFVDANDTPQSIIDKTKYDGIVDLHAEWRSQSGRWLVDLFAKNVTDKRAMTNFPDFTPYFTTLAEFVDPNNHVYLSRYTPARSFGLSVTVTP